MIYKCEERPCNIVPMEELWCICGQSRTRGAGVLAWCYDKDDAEYWFNRMVQDDEFIKIEYRKWIPE